MELSRLAILLFAVAGCTRAGFEQELAGGDARRSGDARLEVRSTDAARDGAFLDGPARRDGLTPDRDGPIVDASKLADLRRPDLDCSKAEVCNGLDDDCDQQIDEGACPAGCAGKSFGGHAYLLCSTSLGWSSAAAFCASKSMQLASIETAAEDAWLFATAKSFMPQTATIWIGGTDAPVEGEWRWPGGALFWKLVVQPGSYAHFGGAEPNDQQGVEDCLQLLLQPINDLLPSEWNDATCSDLGAFVCESP